MDTQPGTVVSDPASEPQVVAQPVSGGDQPTPAPAVEISGSATGQPETGPAAQPPPAAGGQVADTTGKHDLPPDTTILKDLITDQDLKELWDRADAAQQRVNAEVRNFKLALFLLNQIQVARNQVLAGKVYYDDAERALDEVEFRLSFNQGYGERTGKMATTILVYEAIWLVVLAAGIVFLNLSPTILNVDANQLVSSVAWGGLGAVVGGLYALWKHAADAQDFDQQYRMWYLTNPILGISVGAFIFLVIRAGLFSLVAGSNQTTVVSSAWLIYAAAWIAGFKQNVVYQVVHRILNAFQVNEPETPPQAPPRQPGQ